MLGLAAAGGALEFYDFVIFIFLADVVGILFFPPGLPTWLVSLQTFGIFAAGYVVRPLGGIVLAHFGDLFGRKRIFSFSILLMAVSTLGVAVLPNYGTVGITAPLLLLAMRLLQGIAIGGEVPGAWTFAAEHVPSNKIGFASGMVCGGLTIGILVGSIITTAMSLILSRAEILSFGWRFPFLFGGMMGFAGVHLRRMLHETPVFSELQEGKMLVPELPLRVVAKRYKRGVIISAFGTWVLSAGVVVLSLMIPTILERLHHYSHQQALISASISTFFIAIGVVAGGITLDRIGLAKFFILGGILLAIGASAFYSLFSFGADHLYLMSIVIGLSGAVTGGVPVAMICCFPANVRFTGLSFSYNLSYALFGGLTPVCLAALLDISSMAHVYYLFFVSVIAVILGFYFLLFPQVIRYRDIEREVF